MAIESVVVTRATNSSVLCKLTDAARQKQDRTDKRQETHERKDIRRRHGRETRNYTPSPQNQ